MYDTIEGRMEVLIAKMPGYAKFKSGLLALQAKCKTSTSEDNYWVLHSTCCMGDLSLFMLWCLGEDMMANNRSTRDLFGLYTGSRKRDQAAHDHSVDFLCAALKQDASTLFPNSLLLAIKQRLDPKADKELLSIMAKFKPTVLRLFARDQEFIDVIHQHMTYSLLGEEAQHIDPKLLQEAQDLFKRWERSGDGLLGDNELHQAQRHYRHKGELETARLLQDFLDDTNLWRNREMEFAAFVSAYVQYKTSGKTPGGAEGPLQKSQEDLEFQQATQLRSTLIRVMGAFQSFRRLILDAKKDIPDDSLNVYNNAVYRASSIPSTLLRYFTALGTLSIQIILPLCIYIHAKEDHKNTICSGGAPAIDQSTLVAIAVYYILFTLPASVSTIDTYFGNGCKHLRRQLQWWGREDVPQDIMREASTGVIAGVGDASAARRIMASIDLLMNSLYPSLIAILTLYLVYNATSPLDMTKYMVFMHFLFLLDEKFLTEDRHKIRASIILTVLARQDTAVPKEPQIMDVALKMDGGGSGRPSTFATIAIHLFSVLCSVIAMVSPFGFLAYLIIAPGCL